MLCHSKQSVNVRIINNPMLGDTGLKKKKKSKREEIKAIMTFIPLSFIH